MKKIATALILLSLGMFNAGCGGDTSSVPTSNKPTDSGKPGDTSIPDPGKAADAAKATTPPATPTPPAATPPTAPPPAATTPPAVTTPPAAPHITFVAPCDSQKDNGAVPAEVAELLKNQQGILKTGGFLWASAASGTADRAGVYVLSIRVTDKTGKIVTTGGAQSTSLQVGDPIDLHAFAGISPDVAGKYLPYAKLTFIGGDGTVDLDVHGCSSSH